MALKRQNSQDIRNLFDSITESDEEEVVDDNIDSDFSDCDLAADEAAVELQNIENEEENIETGEEEEVQNIETDEEPEVEEEGIWYYAQNKKYKRKWRASPPNVTRVRDFQILRERQGISAETAVNINTHLSAFKKLVPETLINVIVAETNRKARHFYTINSNPARIWYDTNSNEIYALIGILIYAGVHKNWDERLDELYRLDNRPFYRAAMSLQRVQQLLRFLRFDNYQTRAERLKEDKLAAFRDVWNMFLANIKGPYKPSSFLTIDEQLVLTRGRCSFRQYIPSKPGKYGIKIFWICDALNSYPLKAEVYVGKQPNEIRSVDYALNLVHRLSTPYINKGRTITMDNFFTSCPLAEQMLQKKTTIIGTIRSNKPDLPKEFTNKAEIKKRDLNSSKFCFDNHLTLVSYVPKPNKNVLLLSTLHNDDIVDPDTNKPNIILDYNKTKGGVDTLDKLVRTYTCKRKTKRWPMVLFFNMIDIAGIAAYNLYKCANPQLYIQRKNNERKIFLKELAMQLVNDHILHRLSNPRAIKKNVKIAIHQIGYDIINITQSTTTEGTAANRSVSKRPRCYICPRSADKKTGTRCYVCNQPSCTTHIKTVCINCVNEEVMDSLEEENNEIMSDDASG